ncbi:hypothetical protein [Shimia sp.]|uniref:hypothetical protein n=1 Tax=Shimia sp. TaxID=1954381 RepID=UPI003B8CE2B8
MTCTQSDQIIGQLHSALESGRLPKRQKAMGTQVLDHLSEAVRVVVLGRPRSGKSSLINMMIGAEIICPPRDVETTEVVYGKSPQITLFWPDGTSQCVTGSSLENQAYAGANRVKYELPLEALQTQSYYEVAQPYDARQQQKLLTDALQKGQIFVWCSEEFDRAEQDIWESVPDEVKDHSFLALTKADRQIMIGDLSERIAALTAVVADGFLDLHPIATLHAIKARVSQGSQNDLWDASGGRELVEAIQAQVIRGRAAALDQAALLLAQLGDAVEAARSREIPNTFSRNDAPPQTPATQADVLDQLQSHLQTAAKEMLADLDAGRIPDADGLLERCASTVSTLTQSLASFDQSECVAELLEDAQDGEETLMLLQVEKSPEAAEDSVILLLQLKKEIGAREQA